MDIIACILAAVAAVVGIMAFAAARSAKRSSDELIARLRESEERIVRNAAETARTNNAAMLDTQRMVTEMNTKSINELRNTVENRLMRIQEDNAKKLDEMRNTVDEKLNATLQTRLNESFKLVSERLDQVYKGLGEMQTLAGGVGDLKRVLTNVKTRGTWGEIQLGVLLEQMLAPTQFERNVATIPGSNDRVEYAVVLPGNSEDERVYLPIDAKFPVEDYNRLCLASESGDAAAVEEATKQLAARIKLEAKRIEEKYVAPPYTTDFAVMYLPTEGLYAEIARNTELCEYIQRHHRVSPVGPTTLTALLNSLQMGFTTLAIQKRSSEVWTLLGAFKTEFKTFDEILAKTKKKLQEATNTIERAETRTRVIGRKLRSVEELDTAQSRELIGTEVYAEDEE